MILCRYSSDTVSMSQEKFTIGQSEVPRAEKPKSVEEDMGMTIDLAEEEEELSAEELDELANAVESVFLGLKWEKGQPMPSGFLEYLEKFLKYGQFSDSEKIDKLPRFIVRKVKIKLIARRLAARFQTTRRLLDKGEIAKINWEDYIVLNELNVQKEDVEDFAREYDNE